jgi:NAD(P)-dependent dehydrogenase (short-subunit alcohol dehydrogenase family)
MSVINNNRIATNDKKVAMITGASKGLGKFCAERFWEEGYDLFLVASNQEQLDLVKKQFGEKKDRKILTCACDLSKYKDIVFLIKFFKSNFSNLNVMINNAAIQGPIGPLIDNDLNLWKKTLKINFYAPVTLIQGMIPLMKNCKNASIINISGGGATAPRPNFSAYASSKAALVRFSETLAEELKDFGIRVNCVAPGAMKTDMLSEILKVGICNAGEKELNAAMKVLDFGGASMDKVADLLIFLASELSCNISGKLISAVWDDWENWPNHIDLLASTDVYTLRRITSRDRGFDWGDK